MDVILLEDIKGLGRKDEIRRVSDGYARNHLLPKKLAKPATPGEVAQLQAKGAALGEEEAHLRKLLSQLHNETQTEPITIAVEVGEKGQLFASVKPEVVREKLFLREPGLQKESVQLAFAKAIKEKGTHQVQIDLGRGIKDSFTIEVKGA